jgi:hypothetical protein
MTSGEIIQATSRPANTLGSAGTFRALDARRGLRDGVLERRRRNRELRSFTMYGAAMSSARLSWCGWCRALSARAMRVSVI